jgi:hypothetical protein
MTARKAGLSTNHQNGRRLQRLGELAFAFVIFVF